MAVITKDDNYNNKYYQLSCASERKQAGKKQKAGRGLLPRINKLTFRQRFSRRTYIYTRTKSTYTHTRVTYIYAHTHIQHTRYSKGYKVAVATCLHTVYVHVILHNVHIERLRQAILYRNLS
ncbi:hypothetical protein WUBG_04036 [Wuchereria bancrofti]|uniref:Uncharacterized protein n=1 Tax=Wuchereria bancrofti TaxID=6293 RepID=J9ESB7_WUCBA|nr:hypothetical protein WUBG_04036 [Wuchereria bancrofti]